MSLAKALLEVQKELPAIEPDAVNPHFKNKYVSLDRLLAVCLPILNKHGIVLTQMPTSVDGVPALATTFINSDDSDDRYSSTMVLLLEKENSQGLGSAITYGRRYMLAAMLGVSGEKDDDGNAASAEAKKKPAKDAGPVSTPEKLRKRLLDLSHEADNLRAAEADTTWNELQGLCKENEKSLGAMDEDELKELGLALADYVKRYAKPGGISFLEHMTTPGGI